MPLLSLTRGIPLKTSHKDRRNGLFGERKIKYNQLQVKSKIGSAPALSENKVLAPCFGTSIQALKMETATCF
jgi:hypothetical protein